jgi:threonine/homoserine/homoserine lactone efflux protein
MFGIAAVIAFIIALILNLFGVSKGHLNSDTLVIAAWVCLSIYLVWPGWRGWSGRPGGPPA